MAFGEGEHRNQRSGGETHRTSGEIFINTFQGKMAEFAMYRWLKEKGRVETTYSDLSVKKLGAWDEFDLEYEGIHIAVKSTKYYGNLLLLETEDWDEKREYIPNKKKEFPSYDYFVLLRIEPDGQSKMEERRLLYSSHIERKELESLMYSINWKYDIAGYITKKDFVRLISEKYILPKKAMLKGRINGKGTIIDVVNYYIQAGDMRYGEELRQRLLAYKGKKYKMIIYY